MFFKSGTCLVAILLASSAAAAPLSAAQSDDVKAFVDAIKAQLKAQNISGGDNFVEKTKQHLEDAGYLNDKTISNINDDIKTKISEGLSIDEIAKEFIGELMGELASADAIQKRDQDGIVKDALVISPDLVKRIMAREIEARAPCPPMATHGTGFCCPS